MRGTVPPLSLISLGAFVASELDVVFLYRDSVTPTAWMSKYNTSRKPSKKWLQQPGYQMGSPKKKKKVEPCPKQEKLVTVARLPYQGAASHKVSRLLDKFNIQTVHIPAKNIHLLSSVKDKLGLRTAGIYCIPCECGKVYVGQTGRTIETRLKEHRRPVCLNQPERSAVAEHLLTTYHRIDFVGASKLGTATRYMDRLVREAIEI
jgi:hypothetical protein